MSLARIAEIADLNGAAAAEQHILTMVSHSPLFNTL
jgi:hypothetical protein